MLEKILSNAKHVRRVLLQVPVYLIVKELIAETFKCGICTNCFNLSHDLLCHGHKRIQTDEKLFKYDICKNVLQEIRFLLSSIPYTGEKPFECNIFEKTLCQKANLVKESILDKNVSNVTQVKTVLLQLSDYLIIKLVTLGKSLPNVSDAKMFYVNLLIHMIFSEM